MAITFDGPGRLIILSQAGLGVRELWSRYLEWYLTGSNSRFLPAMTQLGGNDIDPSAGTKVPIYAFLQNAWRIRPQESDHTLAVSDGILLVEGGGDPFVSTLGDFTVRINYQQPVQAIGFDSGGSSGGGLTPEQAQMLAEAHGWARDTRAILYERLITDFVDGKLKLYNGAGTVTHQGNIYSDAAGLIPADGTQSIVRRNAMLPVP